MLGRTLVTFGRTVVLAAAVAGFSHGTREVVRPEIKGETDKTRGQLEEVNRQLNDLRSRVRAASPSEFHHQFGADALLILSGIGR